MSATYIWSCTRRKSNISSLPNGGHIRTEADVLNLKYNKGFNYVNQPRSSLLYKDKLEKIVD